MGIEGWVQESFLPLIQSLEQDTCLAHLDHRRRCGSLGEEGVEGGSGGCVLLAIKSLSPSILWWLQHL